MTKWATINYQFTIKEVLEIGITLCNILTYLHSQNPQIIFRDMKPDNIMRTPTGKIYLIDFTLARKFNPLLSMDSFIQGNEIFMAPEITMKVYTDERSDIFTLGATLFTLLTKWLGRVDRKTQERSIKHAKLKEMNYPLIPKPLISLINSMVETERANRPESAEEVRKKFLEIHKQNFGTQATNQKTIIQARPANTVVIKPLPLVANPPLKQAAQPVINRPAPIKARPIQPQPTVLNPQVAMGNAQQAQVAQPMLSQSQKKTTLDFSMFALDTSIFVEEHFFLITAVLAAIFLIPGEIWLLRSNQLHDWSYFLGIFLGIPIIALVISTMITAFIRIVLDYLS